MKTIYISGPMTGIKDLNASAFLAVEARIRDLSLYPVNPHNLCAADWDWQKCMRADIKALCGCDAIYMLDGWQNSTGAQLELHIAHRLGLRVILTDDELREYAEAR